MTDKRFEIQANLQELNITIPTAPAPKGNYVSFVRVNNTFHLCGHLARSSSSSGQLLHVGKLGRDYTVEQGYEAAKACAINIIGTLNAALDGDLTRITKIVKLVGFVNCTEDFTQQPAVLNGASDLLCRVFGERVGQHARSAVGVCSLPFGVAVEVECIVETQD